MHLIVCALPETNAGLPEEHANPTIDSSKVLQLPCLVKRFPGFYRFPSRKSINGMSVVHESGGAESHVSDHKKAERENRRV
jgi:hypothetical protein